MKNVLGLMAGVGLVIVTAVSCSSMNNGSDSFVKKITGDYQPKVAKNVIPYKLSKKKRKANRRSRGIASEGQTPNSERYRQNGAMPETGKSGKRKLQTWALQDAAGTTTVYISTGDVKAGTTEEGTHITKVNFKGTDSAGEAVYNKQYNDLSNDGAVELTASDLVRHQPIVVQTNIKKDGSRRTYVVKTNNTVHLLPDPSMLSIGGDNEVLVGQEAIISGNLRELNGDTGSAGDCVLYVDGAESKRISDVWVDAGDEVVCHFTEKFDTAGDRTVKVSFENGSPADWDSTNNSQEKTITVRSAESNFDYVGIYFYDQDHKDYYKYKNRYGHTHSRRYDYRYQYSYFYGYSYASSNTMNTSVLNMSVTETSGNNTLETVVGQDLSGYCYSYSNYYNYCYYYDYSRNIYMYVQRHANGYTYANYNRYGHKAVYHYGDYYSGGYEQEYSYDYSYGTFLPVSGNEWSVNVSVETGDGTLAFEKDFTLKSNSHYYYNQPWTCNSYGDCSEREYGYNHQYCHYWGDPANAACN